MPEWRQNRDTDAGGAVSGGGAPGDRAQIARERQLRDVELMELEGAVEGLLRIERQIGDRAAIDLDATVADRRRAVVVAACDRDRHLDHGGSFLGWVEQGGN